MFEYAYFDWRSQYKLGYNPLSQGQDFPTFGIPGRRSVRPDGMADFSEIGEEYGIHNFPNASWYEMKTSPGNLAASGTDGNYQIEGFFNALSGYAKKIGMNNSEINPNGTHPQITFVTTWDVALGLSMVNLENKYNINFYQQLAWAYELNGNYYISFGPQMDILKYFPPISGYVTFKLVPPGWR